MATVHFTPHLQRHLDLPDAEIPGATLREVLESVFARNPRLRHYVLDDQGALRKHVQVFVDGAQAADRAGLSDAVAEGGEVYVMQALSGG
jgi:hypothetical protein